MSNGRCRPCCSDAFDRPRAVPALDHRFARRMQERQASGVVSTPLDALARDTGWLLMPPGDEVNLADFTDAFVFGSVAWSTWDIAAAEALAVYIRRSPGATVILFDMDDEEPGMLLAGRFPGLTVKPHAVPVIARYRNGHLERVEQGMAAVGWMEGLSRDPA